MSDSDSIHASGSASSGIARSPHHNQMEIRIRVAFANALFDSNNFHSGGVFESQLTMSGSVANTKVEGVSKLTDMTLLYRAFLWTQLIPLN